MTKLSLGKSSLAVSPMAWGMWRFKGSDVKAARARVEAALAAGLTFLDTADIYGPDNDEPFGTAEALFGQVLKDAPQIRDQVVLASKGGIVMGTPYDSSAAYLESAVEASLSRMGIDKIDLYQIHRPDHLAHPAQVAQVLTRLRSAGKIGEVGLSNHTAAQVSALQAHLAFPIACVQIEFSPLV
ncbi:MAG TPA: aldo/keto reductase, partial [Phenylobacterium sp.]|nr:aldo/keto reductase [Phenylobacterium sp.]